MTSRKSSHRHVVAVYLGSDYDRIVARLREIAEKENRELQRFTARARTSPSDVIRRTLIAALGLGTAEG